MYHDISHFKQEGMLLGWLASLTFTSKILSSSYEESKKEGAHRER